MKIKVKCDNCGIDFYRAEKEIKRSSKLGRHIFCSRKCCGKGTNTKDTILNRIPKEKRELAWKSIKEHCGNRLNEMSPFRYYLRKIKSRNFYYDVTIEDIKTQWELQSGICAYTGVKLELPRTSSGFNNKTQKIVAASLDRIDSRKGYVKGNIQFISCTANHAKNNLTHEEMIEFCNIIANNVQIRPSPPIQIY